MNFTRLISLFSGVFVAGLFLIASPVQAKTFGYFALKGGYSYEMLPKTKFLPVVGDVAYLDSTLASGLPLGVSIGVGHNFNSKFGMRIETEYTHRFKGKFKDSVLKSEQGRVFMVKLRAQLQSLLENLYFDYYVTPSVNLYLSGGIGVGYFGTATYLREGQNSIDATSLFKQVLSWQAGFGLSYALMQNLKLDFNVRYINFGKFPFNLTQNIQALYAFSAVEGLVGISFQF